MNNPAAMGYPALGTQQPQLQQPPPPPPQQQQQQQQTAMMGGNARNGTPTGMHQQLHMGSMAGTMPPPGLLNTDHRPQLLAQLNAAGNGNNKNTGAATTPANNNVPMGTTADANPNANNPLFHPHLEDASLLNNPIWKLQVQLAHASRQFLGQPNIYARQNAMKKYISSQEQQAQQQIQNINALQQQQGSDMGIPQGQQQPLGQQQQPQIQNQTQQQPQLQQQQGFKQGVPLLPAIQTNPQMKEAAISLVDRTKQLLLEMANIDVSGKDKLLVNGADNISNNTPNSATTSVTTATNSTMSTPTTPKAELYGGTVGTPALSLQQQKKISQYNIDEDDEVEHNRIGFAQEQPFDEQLWHAIDLSNLQIFNINDKVFRYHFLTRLYLNGNNLTSVPKEIRNLKNLRVLDLSHNKITELPKELGFCYQLKYLYIFDNLIKTLPWEFGNLSNLQFLGCEGNPLDKQLLKILTEKSVTGLIFYLRDNRPEIPLTEDRKFIEINIDGEPQESYDSLEIAKEHLNEDMKNKSFSLLTYNTLCQHYATPKMYRYTPSWALNWDYRREKLTEQISKYDADILCLQEVESKTFEEYWSPLLKKKGYVGLFHAKTRAKTMQTKDSKRVDGCCLFYKQSEFKTLFKECVDFSGVWMKHKKFQRTEDYLNRAMNKDNVALYVKLEHIKSGETLWVVTTHLHWDPHFNDVKTFQVGVLVDHLETLLKEQNNASTKQDIRKCPIIICGDLNSYLNSAVYDLLSSGHVDEHKDIENRDYGYISQKHYSHNLSLRSTYDCIGELPFTNFSPSFTDVIDYIWYSSQALRVRGVLGKIDPEYVSKFIGFPNDKFPSDHIPLLARYEFVKGGGNNSTSRKV